MTNPTTTWTETYTTKWIATRGCVLVTRVDVHGTHYTDCTPRTDGKGAMYSNGDMLVCDDPRHTLPEVYAAALATMTDHEIRTVVRDLAPVVLAKDAEPARNAKAERAYDRLHNDGGEGFNPHRTGDR